MKRKYLLNLQLTLLSILVLMACSKIDKSDVYGSKKAIKRGDIVVTSRNVSNFNRFEDFLNNISNNKEDKIRVTRYTHEGDPIFQNLLFDGKKIQYEDSCKEIIKKENDGGKTEYIVKGCTKNDEISLIELQN